MRGFAPAPSIHPGDTGSIGADILGRMRSARIVSLIEVRVAEGDGRSNDNLVREVTYLYTPEGELVAKRDPRDEIDWADES